jgi:hypothetical protein
LEAQESTVPRAHEQQQARKEPRAVAPHAAAVSYVAAVWMAAKKDAL